MGEVLKKFGRYFLLDRIAQGGMADIYRARLATSDGARRLIVIKRIQAVYGQNEEFLKMFRSEIEVMLGFNHPNIVQLYDFGEEKGQQFIVMEYVDGKSLRYFLTRNKQRNQQLPVNLGVYIIENAASGLYYAHSFRDRITGNPLNIIHRDVSPQNIIISYDGNVKLIDFGIAKADINAEQTRVGVIKGKPGYLSPEQIRGLALDGRSDMFSLGAVLWETLTGKKLFEGENDYSVLKLIESCNTHVYAPSEINKSIPKELDYIVLKALAKQKEKRYQNVQEFQRTLHKFLYTFFPDFNLEELSYHAKDLFKDDIVSDRKRIQELNNKVEKLIQLNENKSVDLETATPGLDDDVDKVAVSDEIFTPKESSGSKTYQVEDSEKEIKLEMEPSPAVRSSRTSVTESKRISHKTISGKIGAKEQKKPKSSKAKFFLLIAAIVGGVAGYYGFLGNIKELPIISSIINGKIFNSTPTSVSGGQILLEGSVKGVKVYLDNKTKTGNLPMLIGDVPLKKEMVIKVISKEGEFKKNIFLSESGQQKIAVVFVKAPGWLDEIKKLTDEENENKESTPEVDSGKAVFLKLNVSPGLKNSIVKLRGDGEAEEKLDSKRLSGRGPVLKLGKPYELTINKNGFRQFQREFVLTNRDVRGRKTFIMSIELDPSNVGYLTVHTTPSMDATFFIDNEPWTFKTPVEDKKMPVGTYRVLLENKLLDIRRELTVTIREGQITKLD